MLFVFIDILYDANQVLFRPCAAGEPTCYNPVVSFQHKNTCILHRDVKSDNETAKKVTGQEDEETHSMGAGHVEPELFQTIDDISSLALDAEVPSTLFLDQFGDLGPSDLLAE